MSDISDILFNNSENPEVYDDVSESEKIFLNGLKSNPESHRSLFSGGLTVKLDFDFEFMKSSDSSDFNMNLSRLPL